MAYIFYGQQLHEMLRDARSAASRSGAEICGLLVDNCCFIEMIKLRNKTKRGGGFSYYVDEVRLVRRASRLMAHEIVGTFHSHPCYLAKPGESDIANAVDDSLMLIIDVQEQEARLWHIASGKAGRRRFVTI
ncbi:MAG: Mov34/MPN/PAD-1 family protein [Deltaproteobacteria bacterium]|nr:Mov34/MPN/PAD-1 family protein [Deltaproteobacteria bacterium]